MRPPIGGWDEVERGFATAFLSGSKKSSYGYSILDFLVVLAVMVSILTVYCAGDEIYGLNTWTLF